jgi:hypothetical protein
MVNGLVSRILQLTFVSLSLYMELSAVRIGRLINWAIFCDRSIALETPPALQPSCVGVWEGTWPAPATASCFLFPFFPPSRLQ